MQHHLVTVAGRTTIQVRRQRRLGQQTEGIGSALRRRHLLCPAPQNLRLS